MILSRQFACTAIRFKGPKAEDVKAFSPLFQQVVKSMGNFCVATISEKGPSGSTEIKQRRGAEAALALFSNATDVFNAGGRDGNVLELLKPIQTFQWLLGPDKIDLYKKMTLEIARAIEGGTSTTEAIDNKDCTALVEFDKTLAGGKSAKSSCGASKAKGKRDKTATTKSEATENAKMMRFFNPGNM